MINTIRLLQVGDVHLPTAAKKGRNLDDKDSSFPPALKSMMARVPAKEVFRKIYEVLDAGGADAVLFMGDLTDKGSVEHYESAVRFLANALQIGSGRELASLPVGIVPGNHDINRALAKRPGFAEKFKPLNDFLGKHGLPSLPVEESVLLDLASGNAAACVVLMNSCWGCGSTALIPEEFREPISRAIDDAITEGGEAELDTYYDRQLDTPAFSDQSISDLIDLARRLPGEAQIIAVAHHNLLPQRTARIAPYTELVNSGKVREACMQLRQPVIYLHGHIHEDPIEIVKSATGEALVCISAPAAEDGFNVVEVKFTRNGIPLACDVIQWRFDGAGMLREQPAVSIPLIGSRRRSHSSSLSKIYSLILDQQQVWWSDLTSRIPPFFTEDNESELVEAIELLRADNSVIVENYTMSPANWIVRANL